MKTAKAVFNTLTNLKSALQSLIAIRARVRLRFLRRKKPTPRGVSLIRTRIRPQTTRVPPKAAEHWPPGSRRTADEDPVSAHSSTIAVPSTTSPSAGTSWPGRTHTTGAGCRPLAAKYPMTNRPAGIRITAKIVKPIPKAPTHLPMRMANAPSRMNAMPSLSADFTGCSRPQRGRNQENVQRAVAASKRGHRHASARMPRNPARIILKDDPGM
jgi:hypothetical protein